MYIKRANLNVLVIGKDGGALEKTNKIDNYYGFKDTISGKELLLNGLEQAKRLGVQIETDEVIGLDYSNDIYEIKTRNNLFKGKALILATGTSRKTPNIKGVKEFEGRGVSYCAVCDAFFYRNKDVSVLGSGDYALEEAKTLLPVAKTVSILTNGEELIENRSVNYNDFIINENEIEEIRGDNKIDIIQFKDGNHIKTDGLFIAIGTASSTDLARKIGAIIKDGNIIVNKNMETNVPGLYACGDCTGGLLQISKAVYEGAVAGITAIKYLRGTNMNNIQKL